MTNFAPLSHFIFVVLQKIIRLLKRYVTTARLLPNEKEGMDGPLFRAGSTTNGIGRPSY